MKEYIEYLNEIEALKDVFDLSAIEVLTLSIAASFECYNLNFDKLKKEFVENAKKNTRNNN